MIPERVMFFHRRRLLAVDVMKQQARQVLHDLILGQEPVCARSHSIRFRLGLDRHHQDGQIRRRRPHVLNQGSPVPYAASGGWRPGKCLLPVGRQGELADRLRRRPLAREVADHAGSSRLVRPGGRPFLQRQLLGNLAHFEHHLMEHIHQPGNVARALGAIVLYLLRDDPRLQIGSGQTLGNRVVEELRDALSLGLLRPQINFCFRRGVGLGSSQSVPEYARHTTATQGILPMWRQLPAAYGSTAGRIHTAAPF